MREKFIAGNWKMNLDCDSATELARAIRKRLADGPAKNANVDVAVCPPAVYLAEIAKTLAGSEIGLGAQNVYFEGNGAFTGEISVNMLKDVGCKYAVIGHSERRHILGETDELVNKKVVAAIEGGLDVILCIGELLEERETGQTEAVIERHLKKGLVGVGAEQMKKVTIAYEPVWAIGTGKTATPQQAQDAHKFARGVLAEMFAEAAQKIRIQYGGSVKPANAKELLQQEDVDGALVGGASLTADDFLGIIEAGCL